MGDALDRLLMLSGRSMKHADKESPAEDATETPADEAEEDDESSENIQAVVDAYAAFKQALGEFTVDLDAGTFTDPDDGATYDLTTGEKK